MNDRKKQLAAEIVEALRGRGFEAYFVGGCVRDLLLNREPRDYDIATNALPEAVQEIFPRTIEVGKQFGVLIVVMNGFHYQVATFRSESDYRDGRHPGRVEFGDPRADALRRDFTINGMFYDPFGQRVIDYVNGQEDLKNRIIRAIGNPRERFNEDYLRMLRAVRFAAELNFNIESETFKAIQENAEKISQISNERIREELLKLFLPPHAARGLELLRESGLLKVILPEIYEMIGCEQSPVFHPEGDVYIHTLRMLENLPPDANYILVWSVLLHDVGKPRVAAIMPDDAKHFYQHEKVGAEMAKEILSRLRFTSKEIEDISTCVHFHMQLKDAAKMKKSTLRRIFSRETFDVELELHRLDCIASQRKLDNYEFLKKKKEEFASARQPIIPPPLVNGEDLKQIGYTEGKFLGSVLKEIQEKQLMDEFRTREQALEYARRRLQESNVVKQ